MTFDVYWRIPMSGDRSSWRNHPKRRGDWSPSVPGSLAPGRRAGEPDGLSYVEHIVEVARATEAAGFVGGLLPSFPQTDDPWVAAAAAARATTTYRFMVAFQPGFLHPVHAARMSATFQRLSRGRLVFNIITGGGGPAQLWWGDSTPHDARYARTSEFLHVFSRGGTADRSTTTAASTRSKAVGCPRSSRAGRAPRSTSRVVAGRHRRGRPSRRLLPLVARAPRRPADKFDAVREASAAAGRTPRFAVRAHVIARPTAEEAWEEVRLGWERVDPAQGPAGQRPLRRRLDRGRPPARLPGAARSTGGKTSSSPRTSGRG